MNKFHRLTLPGKVGAYVLCGGLAVATAFPILWMTLSVFKPSDEIINQPFKPPTSLGFDNLRNAWELGKFGVLYINSVIVTVVSVFGILFLEGMAAYAFARLRFRGRNLLFLVFLVGQLVPAQMIVIPSFIEMSQLRLLDTKLSLILQYLSWAPFAILFLRASFLAVPREIEEAALLDGASRMTILWRIMLPLTRSAFATVATIYALWIWNDFLYPLVYLRSESNFTVPLGLAEFQGLYTTFWGYLLGAISIAVWPPLLVYLALSRPIQERLATGALR
jgi:ABC-type glycerol-3-phosphate transport system permease component